MKERPIIFSAPMVRAILDGKKTQTRRIVKGLKTGFSEVVPSLLVHRGDLWDFRRQRANPLALRCPYGAVGDQPWVREAFAYSVKDPEAWNEEYDEDHYDIVYRATHEVVGEWTHYNEDGSRSPMTPPWRSPIHMPRWASRITLEISDVRVQRVQEISEADAWAEGVERDAAPCDHTRILCEEIGCLGATYRSSLCEVWCSIHGAESWEKNPWVWAITFKRVDGASQ